MGEAAPLGDIVEVDLSKGTWKRSPLVEESLRRDLGGRGLNIRLLFERLREDVDPLGPENILTFSCGLLTGTSAPSASRLHVSGLSPQTGILGSSNLGGWFGVALRGLGIQQLVVRGHASGPVYLKLARDSLEICDAGRLWGLDTWEVEERLGQGLGKHPGEVLSIGPGGESGALFAGIVSGRDHAAGRSGLGTVMGAKNLKAIVAERDKRAVGPSHSEKARDAVKRYIRLIKESSEYRFYKDYGGAGYVEWANDRGILATRNYQASRFEWAAQLNGTRLKGKVVRRRGCYRCPVQCKAELRIGNARSDANRAFRPEFEPMLALGPRCGLSDLEALIHLDNLCSRLGLDSISAGGAIAFAMDLYDRGLISSRDTGGLPLEWGDPAAMEALMRQMAAGEGFGKILSFGIRRAAHLIGRGAEQYAPEVKGMELPGYHPVSDVGAALGYAVSNRGGDFNDIYASPEHKWDPERAEEVFGKAEAVDPEATGGKPQLIRRSMIVSAVLDSLGLCKIPSLCLICAYDLKAEAELTSAFLGRPVGPSELFWIGEDIVSREREFNLAHGMDPEEDRLPQMFYRAEYQSSQRAPLSHEDISTMVKEFYRLMGWDERGRPIRT